MVAQVQLPFKPFTAGEVVAMCKCPPALYDEWAPLLGLQPPDPGIPGEPGLTYVKTFALFVGWKWRQENCPPGKDLEVARFLASFSEESLIAQLAQGNTWPATGKSLPANPLTGDKQPPGAGILVPPPDGRPLFRRLDLVALSREFRERVTRVFPNG